MNAIALIKCSSEITLLTEMRFQMTGNFLRLHSNRPSAFSAPLQSALLHQTSRFVSASQSYESFTPSRHRYRTISPRDWLCIYILIGHAQEAFPDSRRLASSEPWTSSKLTRRCCALFGVQTQDVRFGPLEHAEWAIVDKIQEPGRRAALVASTQDQAPAQQDLANSAVPGL